MNFAIISNYSFDTLKTELLKLKFRTFKMLRSTKKLAFLKSFGG